MKKFFCFKLKFFLVCSSFVLISCQHEKDPYLSEFKDTPEEVILECQRENPGFTREDCDIKRCFSNKFVLSGIKDQLEIVSEILSEMKIPYAFQGATLLGALRFRGPLPWDDDSDIDVEAYNITKNINELRFRLLKKGFIIKPNKGGFGNVFNGTNGFWQVLYTKTSYVQLLLKVDNNLTMDDIEILWNEYNVGDHLPHLDILMLSRSNSKLVPLATVFIDQDYYEYELFPLKSHLFLNKLYSIPNRAKDVVNRWYGDGQDVVNDFFVQPPHRKSCANPRFRDIRNSPHTYQYMLDYLKFTFGKDYKGGPSDILVPTK